MSSPTGALLRLVTTSAVSYFIPPLLVQGALTVLYRIFPRIQPNAKHARAVHHAILWIYAVYIVLSAYSELPVNYYDLLGIIPPSETTSSSGGTDRWKESILRPRWLSLARTYHPDKQGGSEGAHAIFRQLQRANEVLKHDLMRRAYEKFGPLFVEYTPLEKLRTERDVLVHGLLASVGWYIVSCTIFIAIPALSGRSNKKIFWRLTSLIGLFANELSLLSSTTTNHTIVKGFSLLTYECISILRQAWIALNVILSHLPYLSDEQPTSNVAAQIGPLLSSMAVRSDISTMSLDRVIKAEVSSSSDPEASLDRIIHAMGSL